MQKKCHLLINFKNLKIQTITARIAWQELSQLAKKPNQSAKMIFCSHKNDMFVATDRPRFKWNGFQVNPDSSWEKLKTWVAGVPGQTQQREILAAKAREEEEDSKFLNQEPGIRNKKGFAVLALPAGLCCLCHCATRSSTPTVK